MSFRKLKTIKCSITSLVSGSIPSLFIRNVMLHIQFIIKFKDKKYEWYSILLRQENIEMSVYQLTSLTKPASIAAKILSLHLLKESTSTGTCSPGPSLWTFLSFRFATLPGNDLPVNF